MKKILTLLFIVFSCITTVHAQIANAQKGENGKYGFVDKDGRWVIKPIYYWTYWFEDKQYGIFKTSSEKDGAVNKWGEIIIPCQYVLISMSYDKELERYEVLLQKEKGSKKLEGVYEDKNWKEIIPVEYESILKEDNIYYCKRNGKKGILNTNGEIVIPVEYESILKEDNIYYCKRNGKEGILNTNGEIVIPVKYVSVHKYEDGFLVIVQNEKKGYLDTNGKIIVPAEYVSVRKDEGGFFVTIEEGGKEGYLDINGKMIVPASKYDYITKDGDYLIAHAGSFKAYYDKNGNDVFNSNLGYGSTSRVAGENIFLVEKNGKYGYYANGHEIIPCQYDYATPFINDVATVKKDGQVKLIKNPLKDGSQIQIAENVTVSPKQRKKIGGPAVSRYPAPNSDVDKDIPTGQQRKENTFAFIIANENYPDAPVPYSLNDGRIFKEYCSKTLGIPEKNINMYEDATFGTIIAAVEKMKSIADAYDGEASVIFYYAGHGFPDEKQSTAYLLPIDGNASDITTTGYSLAKLYKDLASLKLKSSVVFLDACFSGAKREDNMLASSRGVAIKIKEEAPTGNMVVFSAAQGDETAHQLEEKGHGLFTYYLLKELQQTNGDVTLGELSEFVTKQVKRQSVVINNKKQTPTVIPSQAVVNSWQGMKLK